VHYSGNEKLTMATGSPTGEPAPDLSGQNSVVCRPLPAAAESRDASELHPRGPPQMVAAAVPVEYDGLFLLLSAACIAGAEAARLHRGRKDRTEAITIYPMAA
jgi:hypothetical protein